MVTPFSYSLQLLNLCSYSEYCNKIYSNRNSKLRPNSGYLSPKTKYLAVVPILLHSLLLAPYLTPISLSSPHLAGSRVAAECGAVVVKNLLVLARTGFGLFKWCVGCFLQWMYRIETRFRYANKRSILRRDRFILIFTCHPFLIFFSIYLEVLSVCNGNWGNLSHCSDFVAVLKNLS